jgi:prophage DNA circulation protein
MSATWEDLLQEGSYDGVRFDFVSTKDAGSNDLDKQKFPGRAGQRVVGRGEAGSSIDVTAIFIEEDYPDTMNALLAKLRNGGAVKKLVHPVFGELNASVDNWTVNHDADDALDSATISIKFEVSNEDEDAPRVVANTTPARANEVRSLGDSVLVALSAFEDALAVQNQPVAAAVIGAVNTASSIADGLEATFQDLSVLDIQAQTNGGLASCDAAIVLVADCDTTEQYELSAALSQMAAALRSLAQDLIEQRPPLSIVEVPADTNLLSLAHAIDADPDELMALNSFPDPSLIPAGFQVNAYAA